MERGGSGPPEGPASIAFDVGVFRSYLETLLPPGTYLVYTRHGPQHALEYPKINLS